MVSLANSIMAKIIIVLPIIILKDMDSPKIITPKTKDTIGSKALKIAELVGPINFTPFRNAINATTVDINAINNIDIIP